MKLFTAEIIAAVRSRRGRRDLRVLGRFFVVLTGEQEDGATRIDLTLNFDGDR